MEHKNLPAAEIAKVQHQESVVLLALQTLNSMRTALDLQPVFVDLKPRTGGVAQSAEDAPTVREVVRLMDLFGKAIAISEEIAREGHGGIVRIHALAPVRAALRNYLACLPEATVSDR